MRPTYKTPDRRMAEIFRQLPQYLARTSDEVLADNTERSRFTCHAVDYMAWVNLITGQEQADVCDHISHTLGDVSTLDAWLLRNGAYHKRGSRRALYLIQMHRIAWMEVLAKEFDQ